ncbi:hypothetical protein SAMN05216315_13730 [Nitrosospira sp. Nsp18]|uniref:hypothetical protein n=1 Tax=Nitrosospira sp. Nsp18 TaxID=1855334 RepID=UPI0008846C13|nr:hypothetical protein [Nitrosospira sp. Nsp18]SDA28294.1 hypothetical protein SAMN05216315_13730 [Nitrosospira sp. Nsp18]
MAFIAPKPPQQALDAVHSIFLDLSRNRAFRTPALRNATGPLQLTEPHQVFTLGLTDLAAGNGLDAAKPTGWRYLVQEGDNVLASAETVAGPREEQVFSAFNEGRFVDSSAKAMRAVREFPEVGQGGFELRLLSVPGLYVQALWLHDPQGKGDLLQPLAPSPVETPGDRPAPAAVLLKELAARARVPIEAPDRTGG